MQIVVGVLTILILLAFTPSEVPAHGSDHPADLRNAGNQFRHLEPLRAAPLPLMLFEDGNLHSLERFRGKLTLVNLWATWCPPCVEELPALDRLQAALANEPFAVVALSIDAGDIEGPAAFARSLGLKTLGIYQDFTGKAQEAFPLYGLPITYLIDQRGLVLGYIVGAAEWESPEAVTFLRHYLDAEVTESADHLDD